MLKLDTNYGFHQLFLKHSFHKFWTKYFTIQIAEVLA